MCVTVVFLTWTVPETHGSYEKLTLFYFLFHFFVLMYLKLIILGSYFFRCFLSTLQIPEDHYTHGLFYYARACVCLGDIKKLN